MNKNYLTQVVWLVVLTMALLIALSYIPPIEAFFTTKQIDMFSDLRFKESTDEADELSLISENLISTDTLDTDTISVSADSLPFMSDSIIKQQIINSVQRKEGEITLIEDYSLEQNGLQNFLSAIANLNNLQRPVRIAFLGDSFIEADIFTQNVRLLLQDLFGGCGVGYMAMHSDFPGFRRTITQVDKGWETTNVITNNPTIWTAI